MNRQPYIESAFTYKDYKCVVLFQSLCHRCGYVGIPKGHSLYDIGDYDDIPVVCHGGVTYTSHNLHGFDTCNDIFWIGFDCAHYNDGKDYEAGRKYFADDISHIESMARWEELDKQYPCGEEVRSQEYVEEQCRQMVDQLIEYDRPLNKFKRWLYERIHDILNVVRRLFKWAN